MNNKYSVYEPNLNTLTAKLTRLNAKLARINVAPITWKQVGHHDEPHPSIENAVVRYIDLEVEGVIPSENGWSFIATVVHTDDGNIVRCVPGYEVPAEYRDRPTWCDHCKTNRVRRDTYIVRHEDGRIMQVGSSCLAEFIGTKNPNGLTKASEHLLNAFDMCDAAQKREWLGGSNAISVYRIDLDTYLGYVAAAVLKMGRYITRKQAREAAEREGMDPRSSSSSATSDIAMSAMRQHSPQYPGVYEITPEAEKLATDAREWVLRKYSPPVTDPDGMDDAAIAAMLMNSLKAANTSLSEFEHNLLACARAEAIEPRLCGIAAFIVEAYRRSQPRPQAAQLNAAGLPRIFAMFKSATGNLKRPAIRLADDAGHYLHLSLAGAASKNAGYIYVKGDRGSDAYYGKISPEGRFYPVSQCPATVEPHLLAFAADPEGVATKYGRLTGNCCFCGRKLTDERSTAMGYGPVCADHFGLNWGKLAVDADILAGHRAVLEAQAAAAPVQRLTDMTPALVEQPAQAA
jgi:hypothetical protein